MSGETQSSVSGWTTDTIRAELLALMEERGKRFDQEHQAIRATVAEGDRAVRALISESDRRYDARFNALRESLTEADKRYEQRFIAQQVAVQDALVAQEKAVNAALLAADRAVLKAETASEKRFENMNEFRGQLADQAATLMPRAEAESRFTALGDKLNELNTTTRDQDDRLREQHQRDVTTIRDEYQKGLATVNTVQSLSTGRDRGIGLSWGIMIAAIGMIVGLAGLGFALLRT